MELNISTAQVQGFSTIKAHESTAWKSTPYHPNHMWCPLCITAYISSNCPHHKIFEEPDSPLISYARRSIPSCLMIVGKNSRTKVVATKRIPMMTRFGPVVAPSMNKDEFLTKYQLSPYNIFRLDVFEDNNSEHMVKYLVLNDEEKCNWMMFVRYCKLSRGHGERIPNCVAYQQGSEGIFFITIRGIRPQEELVYDYCPYYSSHSDITQESNDAYQRDTTELVKSTYQNDRQSRFASILKQPDSISKRVHKCAAPPQDEMHCYHCSLSFTCEDAFNIHCFGHSGEFSHEKTSVIQDNQQLHLPLPVRQIMRNDIDEFGLKRGSFRSSLRCTICFAEMSDLKSLVEHNDAMHSIKRSRIFKHAKTNTTQVNNSSNTLIPEDEEQQSIDLDAFLSNNSSKSDIMVVDLNEKPNYAFGCGICLERFLTSLDLKIHKENKHMEILSNILPQEPDVDFESSNPNAITDHLPPNSAEPTQCQRKSVPTDTRSELNCNICGMDITSRSALGMHMKSHNQTMDITGTSLSNNYLPPSSTCVRSRRKLPKPIESNFFFQCNVCRLRLKNQKTLREHGLTHARPTDGLYPCQVCSSKSIRIFKTFEQLRRHMRFIHSNTIFPCPYCLKTFGRRVHLTNHLSSHTGEKNFVCTYPGCSKAYSRKDKLKMHLKTHTN